MHGARVGYCWLFRSGQQGKPKYADTLPGNNEANISKTSRRRDIRRRDLLAFWKHYPEREIFEDCPYHLVLLLCEAVVSTQRIN